MLEISEKKDGKENVDGITYMTTYIKYLSGNRIKIYDPICSEIDDTKRKNDLKEAVERFGKEILGKYGNEKFHMIFRDKTEVERTMK